MADSLEGIYLLTIEGNHQDYDDDDYDDDCNDNGGVITRNHNRSCQSAKSHLNVSVCRCNVLVDNGAAGSDLSHENRVKIFTNFPLCLNINHLRIHLPLHFRLHRLNKGIIFTPFSLNFPVCNFMV